MVWFNSGANWQGRRNDNGTPTIRMSESVYSEFTANTLIFAVSSGLRKVIIFNKANGSNDLFHPVLHLAEAVID